MPIHQRPAFHYDSQLHTSAVNLLPRRLIPKIGPNDPIAADAVKIYKCIFVPETPRSFSLHSLTIGIHKVREIRLDMFHEIKFLESGFRFAIWTNVHGPASAVAARLIDSVDWTLAYPQRKRLNLWLANTTIQFSPDSV
jgi:hypothetical protein